MLRDPSIGSPLGTRPFFAHQHCGFRKSDSAVVRLVSLLMDCNGSRFDARGSWVHSLALDPALADISSVSHSWSANCRANARKLSLVDATS